MKLKMLFVAMAMFMLASVSHAQFVAIIVNQTPLTTECNGGDPLGTGCNAVIYWDQNNNGVDAADQPAPVGGGFGQAGFNTIDMGSGEELLGIPGGFATETGFAISTNTPLPSRYYVKVECGSARWISRVFTITDGLNDYDLSEGWTCEVTAVPCTAPAEVGIQLPAGGQTPVPFSQCIQLCAGQTTRICLGPLYANHRPHGHVTPGCMVPGGCDVECPPAQFGYDDAGWVYNPANGTWCNVIVGGSDGCACFTIDLIEGVVDVDFSALAGDSKVTLGWNTGAESDMAGYDVMRRVVGHSFEKIATVEATNSSSASSYTFVDENADNGTAYEYTLNMVALNGDVTELGTIASATPSANLAVITEYALHQNYPNPFNPSTSLVFDVVAENVVNLKVYNAMGQEVATLVNGTMAAGRHSVNFDAANLTSGLYFYTVKIGNEFTATKKMLLVK